VKGDLMHDWLARRAREDPRGVCLVAHGRQTTFEELDDQVSRSAGTLIEAGLTDGGRVAVWGSHDLATVRALWAVPRAGAVAVPLNTRLTRDELVRQIHDAAISLLVGPDARPDLGVPSIGFSELAGGPVYRAEPPHAGTPHSIFYTSGTGGTPKGVILTWGNLEAAAGASAQVLEHDAGDCWLAVLPLFHIGGFSILIRSARQGGSVVLDAFQPHRVVEHLRHSAITLVSLVPTMLDQILDIDPGPFPTLRAVLLGGGPIPAGLLARAAVGRVPVLSTYGLTEAASQVATVPLADAWARHRVVQPVPGMDVRIVNEDLDGVPAGARGLVQIRGSAVSPGYLHEPPRPAGTWLTTGDLGVMDGNGNLEIVGRSDDMIITGGENVHPVEVEAALEEHPAVSEAYVYGVADERWGYLVVADVVCEDADEDDLDRFLRGRLAGYKVPREWNFVPAIARNALGKKRRVRRRRG
jgi:O-succinylbenzoic acid--CoA ligase